MTPKEVRTVLAFYPTSRGFGFALFKGEQFLVDWGIKDIRLKDKNFFAIHLIKTLIERYSPEVLVIEDTTRKHSRRHERIRLLYTRIAAYAKTRRIAVCRFTRAEMHDHFGVHTKYAIAEAVARAVPMLASRLPPKRKAWMSEDARQSLFDAVALGIVYFARSSSAIKPDGDEG
ncbi:MAG: hypothetical protein AB3X44_10940 [Leptothrix sp. (in: b-proteobacteria)]